MNENKSQFEHSIRSIYALDGDARVEDYRIRPQEVNDDRTKMSLLMRMAGPHGAFYVRATTTFAADEGEQGHRVEIRRRAGDVVDELEVDWATADPGDSMGATQALHETYIGAVGDWYAYALAAEEAGDAR